LFFQVDDNFHSNPKVMAMLEAEGFTRASTALTLWTLSGSLLRDAGLDGVVTLGQAAKATMDRTAARKAAALLVQYRLWHAPGHTCAICPQPPENGWIFHDWFQFGYGTGEAEKTAVAKRKELRNPAIVEAVWARDTHPDGHARCRYCGRKVVRKSGRGGDRRSTLVGQLDHIDPSRAIGAVNIVVACSECNQTKAQRLPETAGLTLLPAPSQAEISATARPETVIPPVTSQATAPSVAAGQSDATSPDQYENQNGINTGSMTGSIPEVSPPRARARTGAGGVGTGVGLGSPGSSEGDDVDRGGRGGLAPDVPLGAPWGSPWKGHSGPPPSEDLIDEATCSEHGLPEPCRRCAALTTAGGGR
jgi:5-methylcytosine-specific restriction endonuclease McrA